MKHLKAFLLVVLSVVAVSAPITAYADFKTAGEIVEDCNSDAPRDYSMCYGFLMGVTDTLIDINSQFGKRNPAASVCIPNNVTVKELTDVFMKYVQDRPTREHLSAASVAVRAFQDSYPCRGAK